MKTNKKAAATSLERIAIRLEQWQARHMQHDSAADSRAAKDSLLRLLRKLADR